MTSSRSRRAAELIALIAGEIADRDSIDPVQSRLMFEAMREAERDASLRERMGALLRGTGK